MFGPDKCGMDKKFHFIVRFMNPLKGTYEEKHAKKSELLDAYYNDGKTHLYTLGMLKTFIEINSFENSKF